MHSGTIARIAEERDSEPLSRWIGDSTDIPVEDIKASLKENNPTSVTLVIEENGKVLLAAPTYAIALLGFINFNPEATPLERARGLDALKKSAQAFWGIHGVTTIATLTREDYPVAKWALKHGFGLEPRQVLVLTSKPESVKAN